MKKSSILAVLLGAMALYGADPQHIVIGWNDLGMHCANKNFSSIAILPPYNNVTAHVLRVGDANNFPALVTEGFEVTYAIPGNTYSVGKTDFWSYEDKIFGVSLPDNVGLTGNGLSGTMTAVVDHFEVTGIPITPFTDANLVLEAPYQLATLKLYDASDNLHDTTRVVVPVSNEISCVSAGCHASEAAILNQHEREGGFDPANKPILCANCHGSNALGMPGNPEYRSLSYRIHTKHAERTNDCYKCHPGTVTKCLRDVMYSAGLTCQTCHGTMAQFAQGLRDGREPWLEEPQCGNSACHGPVFSENTGKLFRQSRGHGNLFCSTCHGSPHAILPTIQANDNVQNIELQGQAGTLAKCSVCHGITPGGLGPHNLAVPVEISAFAAQVIGNSVRLEWHCEYIVDVYHFEIQRSRDNETFTTIAALPAENAADRSYSYVDENLYGEQELFYRLKIVNLDGTIEFTTTYQVNLVLPNHVTLYDSYPNPFNSRARIKFELPAMLQTRVQIFNANGQLVRTLVDNELAAGLHEISWDAYSDFGRTVPSGMYVVSLKAGEYAGTKKISLIK